MIILGTVNSSGGSDDELSFMDSEEQKAFESIRDEHRKKAQLIAVTNNGNFLGWVAAILFFIGMYAVFFDNSLIVKVIQILFH